MRYPKFLLNAFATLGVFAFIFLACSVAEDVVDDDNPPIQNSIGKYQISSFAFSSNSNYMDVLDTETGIVKHYVRFNGDYELSRTTNTAD